MITRTKPSIILQSVRTSLCPSFHQRRPSKPVEVQSDSCSSRSPFWIPVSREERFTSALGVNGRGLARGSQRFRYESLRMRKLPIHLVQILNWKTGIVTFSRAVKELLGKKNVLLSQPGESPILFQPGGGDKNFSQEGRFGPTKTEGAKKKSP